MMKILILLFFILSVVLFLFFFGLAVIFKVIGTVAGAFGRKVQEELSGDDYDDTVIDVTAEYSHSSEEKEIMAAKSIATAFASSEKVNDLGAVMPLFIDTLRRVPSGKLKSTLTTYKNNMAEINSIIRYSPNFFGYTNELLGQITCGFERIISQKSNSSDDFATGMVYSSDFVLSYMIKLNDLADLAGMIADGELKTELSLAIERLERLDWAIIVYPNHNKNNIRTLHDMASRLAERIQTYLQAKSYGVNSNGARELYATLEDTVYDLNKALAAALDSVANWDLMQAGAELEAMRKELQLRGLY